MSKTLIDDALSLAQAGIAVFPVRDDKRPAIKGWREKATTDEEQLEEWFGGRRPFGIGIPCGPQQDLICFDVDLGHTDDPARIEKLQDFLAEWANTQDDGYVLRKTRSGGYHLIFGWPDKAKPPRRVMPKLDVIIEGFYFVWSMPDGSYTHVRGDLDDIVAAPDAMCEVVERDQYGDGSALMSAEAAHEAMYSNGDSGIRHDALLRMTQDWARDHPSDSAQDMCRKFEEWFRDIYGDRIDADRLDTMLQWELGDASGGELWRAFEGVNTTPEMAVAMLHAAGDKLRAEGRLPQVAEPRHEKSQKSREEREEEAEKMVGEFVDIDLNELRERELPDIDWIVDDLLPAGNLVSITGQSGAGKTRFNAMLMAALSTGQTSKIGLPPAERPIRSLYIANEERTSDVERRLKAAAQLNELSGDMLITVRGKENGRFHLVGPEGQVIDEVIEKLAQVVNEREIELVMIDPIVTIGIEDENAASQVDAAMQALQALTVMTGACVLYVHHTPKGDRAAPVDQWRGDSGAWRGSGVFYSSLDLGLTLVPWLPEECHDKQGGKEARRRWAIMVRNHQVPKYVVLDSAKERENEGLPATMYEIVGQEVRVGGRKIGALRPVSAGEAQNTATMALSMAPEVDAAVGVDWARCLMEHPEWSEEGRHKVSLKKIAQWFDEQSTPAGWDKDRNRDERLRFDRGLGGRIIEILSPTHKTAAGWVHLLREGREVYLVVSVT